MKDPKRFLQKILGSSAELASYQATGEPLDQLVEVLREVNRLRKLRTWLVEHSGIDCALSPQTFHRLLEIPEINYSEETDRNLDITQHSLKEARDEEDPVAVAHLNACLRELFRDLSSANDLRQKEYPQLLLVSYMAGDLVDRVTRQVNTLRDLKWGAAGYLFTGWKAREVEREFETLFPDARGAHPLRRHLDAVRLELGFYSRCLEINIKWADTGLDLFRILRNQELPQTLQNLSELGSGLWNVVYNGMRVKTSLELAGIRFHDIRTLFDAEQVPLGVY